MSFERYMRKKSDVESARNLYEYAGAKLDLERIRCRLAEIESQAEPLDTLINNERSDRENMIAVAFYVVVGRFPEEKK